MNVTTRSGIREVPGLPSGVPGLAVTRAADNPAILVITHVRSGLAVARFPHGDPEAVLACAHALAGIADWTALARELRPAITRAEPAIARWGGTRDPYPMATEAELAADIRTPGGQS